MKWSVCYCASGMIEEARGRENGKPVMNERASRAVSAPSSKTRPFFEGAVLGRADGPRMALVCSEGDDCVWRVYKSNGIMVYLL